MLSFKKDIKPVVDNQKIEDLLTRSVENIYPNKDFLKDRLLRGERVHIYLGIDPTGPTLHIGHMIIIRKLQQFQQMGHKVTLLIGDFTATIGDPTGKSETRKVLSSAEVSKNCKLYKKQTSTLLSFTGSNKASIVYNSKWLSKMGFADVLNLSSYMTVEQMLKRDMFEKRILEKKPIYIHEFLYPLLQGYDSVALDVDGEIGGNDQTFNMLVGRDLVKHINKKEKFVITMKLLADSSGKKMGKSEGNMISLLDIPSNMFGKIMSWTDGMILPAFELCTSIPLSDIEIIKNDLKSGVNPKELKVKLAKEIISTFYDRKLADDAALQFEHTFSSGLVPNDVVEVEVSKDSLLVDVLLKQGLVSSKTEFRRLVDEGAILNIDTDYKIEDYHYKIVDNLVVKVGKRRFLKIISIKS